jgi:peptidoglycan/xylan/chitin deacetylase (PgdA/CDA1 family)
LGKKGMKKVILTVSALIVLLFDSGCSFKSLLNSPVVASEVATPEVMSEPLPPTMTLDPTPSITPFQPAPPTPTMPPPPTATPLPTCTPTPTKTPVHTPTATWAFNPAGKVIAPILLYHHIAEINPINRYYVSPQNFRAQLESLRDWGFTTITASFLISILVNGGELPPRPVLITFDDGDLDVYENAFTVMRELGFVGTFYIVSSRMGASGYVSADQLIEMAAAGWEIGSHSKSHVDLTLNHDLVRNEMLQSRLDIEDAVGVTVTSIAYPYGTVDAYIAQKAQDYGYTNGMGLGVLTEHTWGSMYYLNRREVHGDMDLAAFAALLPWSGPILPPTETPTPTPTSTPAP